MAAGIHPSGRASEERPAPAFLAVDFFCGAGGTTRGLLDAGGYVIAGIDKEDGCRRTYVENNTNSTHDRASPAFLKRDIFARTEDYPGGERDELVQELDAAVAWARAEIPGVPLLFAVCAPCQPFTTLSRNAMSEKRLEKRKQDGNLLRAASAFVARYRPELVLSENVASIHDARYGGIWATFGADLDAMGYAVGTRVVCVSDFGVAQFRKRSILLAVRRDVVVADRLTGPDGRLSVPVEDPDAPAQSVEEVIGHFPALSAGETHPLVPNHRARSLSPLNIERISHARPGENNKYLEDTASGDLSLGCHRRVNARLATRCFNDVYTRMRPDRPSPTITTKCHSISNGRFGHYDTRQMRGISLREAAALQSFADDYVFHPTEQIEPIARMIGNAVPPKLASFLSGYLARSVSRPSEIVHATTCEVRP